MKKEIKEKNQHDLLKEALCDYLSEAKHNAEEWQSKAEKSWDMVHGRVDWSHKTAEQAKVHINRVGLAQEQIKAQIKQGLMNFERWLVVQPEAGFDPENEIINENNARRIVERGIKNTNPKAKITDNIGVAAVENVLATKLKPVVVEKAGPGGVRKKELHIEHIPLNIRNYYPDARNSGLYQFIEAEYDYYQVVGMAAQKPTKEKPFYIEKVKDLNFSPAVREEETEESRDRGNDTTPIKTPRRKTVVLHEFWGTVLDADGEIMKWTNPEGKELELRNVIVTMANEDCILSEPQPFPCWDGTPDVLAMQLLRSNINVYGRSLLAPGVDMNKAEDELLNAGIDAAKKEAYNLNTLKIHGLADKRQASGGLRYGETLLQNNQLQPGEKLVDTVRTGQVPSGLLSILGIVQAAGSENMRLNEISLGGNLPTKQTRATEIVAAQQTIQGLFESIIADIEDVYIEWYARKVFCLMLQFSNLWTDDDVRYIFYSNQEKIDAFKKLTAKQRFEQFAYSFRFRGKGIRSLSQNARISNTIVQILSMLVANPLLADAFERKGFDAMLMLEDVLQGAGLDTEKYKSIETAQFARERQLIREQALAQQEAQTGQSQPQPPGPTNPPQQGQDEAIEPGNAS